MIVNVISGQSSGYTNPNPFPGMSLAEACGMAQAYTADALNEMNMSILLNEHAYLLENGTEIEYVNEANYQLKEKIKTAIDKVSKTVSDMWDKLMNWIAQRVEDVREQFGKMQINKKKLDNIIANWKEAGDNSYTKEFSDWIEIEKLSSAVASQLEIKNINAKAREGADASKVKKDIKDAVSLGKKVVTINREALTKAEKVVFETDRTLFNDIRKNKSKALKYFNDIKKEIKENDGDDKGEKIKLVNAKCRLISLISSELIKMYHAYTSQNVKVLSYALHNKSIRADNDKFNTDADKALEKAMHNMSNKTKIPYSTIQQRFNDGDTEYTRAKIMAKYGPNAKKNDVDEDDVENGNNYNFGESAIFNGSRFFSI